MSEPQRFTIAREQAIAKMREYALRHPDQWVLELVQAAVLRGAQQMAVDLKDHRLTVSWVGGAEFTAPDLANLFDHLFARPTDPVQRAVQQLALGVNALLQQRAAKVVIRSGNGTPAGSVRAEVARDGTITVHDEPLLVGTTVSIALRRPSLFQSWFRPWAEADEERMLRERGTFIPIPVFTNGTPLTPTVPTALRAAHLSAATHIEDGPLRAVLGTARPRMTPHIAFVLAGVVIVRKAVPELGERTAGVVWDDRLRKTADGADIVMDATYNEVIARCQQAVLPLLQSAHAAVSTRAFTAPSLPGRPGSLPDPLPQVAPRPDLTADAVDALPQDIPVFVVDPDLPLSTDSVLDPSTFPWPVLLLRPGSREALAARFPDHTFARLTTAEDARFLRDMRLRSHPRVRTPAVGAGSAAVEVEVERDPSEQALLASRTGAPLLHRTGGRTVSMHRLQTALPGVRILVEAEVLPERTVLLPAIRRGLTTALEAVRDDPVAAPLRAAIAVAWAMPSFVTTPDGPKVHLSLPGALRRVEQTVLDQPIAGGPSANALASVMGTPRTLAVSEAMLPALWPLESRLGVGHLDVPSRNQRILAAVGARQGQWTWLEPSEAGSLHGVSDVLVLCASLSPAVELEGFTAQPDAMPGIAHLARDPSFPVVADVGLALLAHTLDEMAHHNTWPEALRPIGPAMGRWAQLALGHPPRDLAPALRDATVRVHPPSGVSDPDPSTVALTLDEAVAAFAREEVPLRLDDPPCAWEDPGNAVVARVNVYRSWGHGWLALPRPYDPTLGVLWSDAEQVHTVPSIDARWPCRGHITAHEPLTAQHIAELQLLARSLYTALQDRDAEDEDARRYRDACPSPAERSPSAQTRIVRALTAAVPCTVTWCEDEPTAITRDGMGALSLRIGEPHREWLLGGQHPGSALLDLSRRLARASGNDATQTGVAVAAAWSGSE